MEKALNHLISTQLNICILGMLLTSIRANCRSILNTVRSYAYILQGKDLDLQKRKCTYYCCIANYMQFAEI